MIFHMSDAEAMFNVLRQSADAEVVAAIERLIRDAPDHRLCRVNVVDFAAKGGLNEERVIAAFLHASRTGLFDLSWNVLCPGCGGVLDANNTLKTIHREEYECELCAAGYEPTLDEMVEVTFTVAPRVRRIAAHDPETLPIPEYFRQIFWCSGIDLPDDFERIIEDFTLDAVELPPGGKAILSMQLPAEFVIVFEPVTHAAQFLDVKGEPTRERQNLSLVFSKVRTPTATMELRPGPFRLSLENRTNTRVLPGAWIGSDALDVNQRLNITSLTFLFTDLKGSTQLYERVGDLAAYDLVRAHFRVLTEIVASEAGAVVKTIGDAVMATFPTPDRAVGAALRMREAMRKFNEERKSEDLLLKIGIHEGPCLAVTLNDRRDYFGQTVNIASRVQNLAVSRAIYATGPVVENAQTSMLLKTSSLEPVAKRAVLRGIADEMTVYEIP